MKQEIILAGFETEETPTLALAIAYGSMLGGKHVSWEPLPLSDYAQHEHDYLVVISDVNGAQSGISNFDGLVALNQRAIRHYEDRVRSGGIIIFDSSHLVFGPSRTDVTAIAVPEAAPGTRLVAIVAKDLFVFGALIGAFELMSRESAIQALTELYPTASPAERFLWREALEDGERQLMESSAALV